jgi:hypothetical protein
MEYPLLYRVRQKLNQERLADIPAEVFSQFQAIGLAAKIKPGWEVAVTAGSRGIANQAAIIRCVCDYVRQGGARPFIVPSMGSHGGASAEGQRQVLEKYGVTEEAMGCEIRSSMEAVLLGRAANGAPVYMDANAFKADGIISVNRVKPHTDLIGKNESGVVKMIVVGLGKEKGATAMHGFNLGETIPLAFTVALAKGPLLAGLAIVENARDETWLLKAMLPEDFLEEDARLLELAYRQAPQLPCDDIDLLVVKELGKAYSGTGMDTKVIGRIRVPGIPEPQRPRVNKLVALRLSPSSYGNALGIGLADITTRGFVESIDMRATHINIIPTTYLERGKIPLYFDTEEEAVQVGYRTLGNIAPAASRTVIIDNTLHLEEFLVSQTLLDELLAEKPDRISLEERLEFRFDAAGRLAV